MVVDYDDGAVRLAVRFDKLSVAAFRNLPARNIETPFEVRVKYAPRIGSEGIYFDRLELPQIEGSDDSVMEFLLPRVEAFFAERLYPDGLAPVTGGFFEVMTRMKPRELRSEKGWLVLGFAFDGDLQEVLNGLLKGGGKEDRSRR